jgi:hypothetical protein
VTPDVPQQQWVGGCKGSGDDACTVWQFFSPAVREADGPSMKPEAVHMIHLLVEGPKSLDQIIEEAGGDNARTTVAELVEEEYIVKDHHQLRLNLPVLTKKDNRIVNSAVDPICQE